MKIPHSSPENNEQQLPKSRMRISLPHNGFLRPGAIALLAFVALSFVILREPRALASGLQPERPPMYVLQVGIGKYQHTGTWMELRGAVTDVLEMRKVLEGDRWKVPAANILTLTDAEGTKQNIFDKFQSHLIDNAEKQFKKTNDRRKGAIVMFQFSGHGSQAPDQDGDEKDDGKDETLVTVDSQDAPGKNFDITDDEIYALTSKLRAFTDNIIYVFDSCHSGSGTRDSGDVRRVAERKNPVVPIPGIIPATRSGESKPDDAGSGVLPPGDDYIVITAAQPNQLASQRNCFEECGQTERPVVYGYLTYYLIEELKTARNDTSYRELMENVVRKVTAEKPTQTPQLEGDRSRFVFGALGRTEDSFVRVSEPETKGASGVRHVKIAAGAMQGLTVGTIVSFYDKTVARFDSAEKLASGTVTAVTGANAMVRLSGTSRPIATDDKAQIVSPDLGTLSLKLNLQADQEKLTASEKDLFTGLRTAFTAQPQVSAVLREVDLAAAPAVAAGRWDVALLKDKYAALAAKNAGLKCEAAGGEAAVPAADTEVLYLAGKDFVPLYGFCIYLPTQSADERNAATTRIARVISHMARLKSVNAITNRRSTLTGKVSVKPIRMSGPFRCDNSKFVAGSSEAVIKDAKSGYYKFSTGEVFWLEVTNNSPNDLYLVLLNMAPDGSVRVVSPRSRLDEEKGVMIPKNGGTRILMSDECRADSNGNFLEAGAFRISKTLGIDKFKLIASTEPMTRSAFQYLELPPLAAQRGEIPSMASKKDWTTVETFLQVSDTRK